MSTQHGDEQSVAERFRRELLAEIDSGDLSPGDRIGSERQLAETYGVSRTTVRVVLADLEEAGLVRRLPGRSGGTFVNHRKVERDLGGVRGLPDYLAKQGYSADSRVIATEVHPSSPKAAAALGITPGELVISIRRLRLADGTPLSLDHAQFPADRFAGLMEMPLGGSIYGLLEREFGVRPDGAEERIEVVKATDEEARMLAITPGEPLLLVKRTTLDEDGRPIEYSSDLFRADRTRIALRNPGRGIRSASVSDGDFVELRGAV